MIKRSEDGATVEFSRPSWLSADREERSVSQLMAGTRDQWLSAVIGSWRAWWGPAPASDSPGAHPVFVRRPLIAASDRELQTVYSTRPGSSAWGSWPESIFEASLVNGPSPGIYLSAIREHRDAVLRGGIVTDGWGPLTAAVLTPPPRSNRLSLLALAEDAALLALRDGLALIHGVSPAGVGVSALVAVPISALIDVEIGDDHETSRVELVVREPDPAYADHSRALVYSVTGALVEEIVYRSVRPDPEGRMERMAEVPELRRYNRTREIPVVPVYAGGRRRPWSAGPPLAGAAVDEVHLIDVDRRIEMLASAPPRVFISGAGSDPPQVRWDAVMLPPEAGVTPWHVDAAGVTALAERSAALRGRLMERLMLDSDSTPSRPSDGMTATETRARSAGAGAFRGRLGRGLQDALQAAAEIAANANGEAPGTITVEWERGEGAALGDISAVGAEADDDQPPPADESAEDAED